VKSGYLLFLFVLLINSLFAQENKEFTNTLSIQSYIDFTKSAAQPAFWTTYDYKKISVEARYGYDWEKGVSLYAGPFFKCRNWDFRLLGGVLFGNTTGFSFSPTIMLETKKVYFFNQPQYVIGLSNMPSNFSHWGEFYYKFSNAIWAGVTERYYIDKTSYDFAFGPQISITYKNLYIAFYWWIPSRQTESKAFLAVGYEHEF